MCKIAQIFQKEPSVFMVLALNRSKKLRKEKFAQNFDHF